MMCLSVGCCIRSQLFSHHNSKQPELCEFAQCHMHKVARTTHNRLPQRYRARNRSKRQERKRQKASKRFAISWILFYSLVIIIMIKTDYSSHLEWAQTASSSSCTFYLRFRLQPPQPQRSSMAQNMSCFSISIHFCITSYCSSLNL